MNLENSKKIYVIICSFQNAYKDSRTLKTEVEKDSRTNIKGNTVNILIFSYP